MDLVLSETKVKSCAIECSRSPSVASCIAALVGPSGLQSGGYSSASDIGRCEMSEVRVKIHHIIHIVRYS